MTSWLRAHDELVRVNPIAARWSKFWLVDDIDHTDQFDDTAKFPRNLVWNEIGSRIQDGSSQYPHDCEWIYNGPNTLHYRILPHHMTDVEKDEADSDAKERYVIPMIGDMVEMTKVFRDIELTVTMVLDEVYSFGTYSTHRSAVRGAVQATFVSMCFKTKKVTTPRSGTTSMTHRPGRVQSDHGMRPLLGYDEYN